MQERPVFGRRTAAPQAGAGAAAISVGPPVAPLSARPPQPSAEDWSTAFDTLSPEAEAFRREMHNGPKTSDAQFVDWRQSQRLSRLVTMILRVALMAPGVIVHVLQAPESMAIGLEVAGFGLGWWLKRARKRYVRTVVDWKDPLEGPVS